MPRLFLGVTSSVLLLFSFQNCGDAGFIVSSAQKTMLLKKAHVLADSKTPQEDGEDQSSSDPETSAPHSTSDEPKVPAQVICADESASDSTSTPKSMSLTVFLSSGPIANLSLAPDCQIPAIPIDLQKRPHELSLASVSNASCPSLVSGVYLAVASDQVVQAPGFSQRLIVRTSFSVNVRNDRLAGKLLIEKSEASVAGTLPVFFTAAAREEDCDSQGKADPLVIDLNTSGDDGVVSLSLTDVLNGVLFDILGSSAGHAKQQVAWMNRAKPTDHYFVALPDASGRVLGIDQLFGDRTQGPDGLNAPDGFAALAKYDGRCANGTIDLSAKDGVIDAKDAVFSQLRFWSDRNGNGVVDSGELKTAKELGIKMIDLRYDPSFREIDKNGNVAKFKSVVQTTDGKLHVIFDLFLQYR